MDADFYAVQGYADICGNDVYTVGIFKNEEDAKRFIESSAPDLKPLYIVPQKWGKYVWFDD